MNALTRQRMPDRRQALTFDFEHDRTRYHATIGFFDDGRIGEVFLRAAKPDSGIDHHAHDGAILVSLLLQHGVLPTAISHSLKRNPNGGAAGPIGHVLDLMLAEERRAAPNKVEES